MGQKVKKVSARKPVPTKIDKISKVKKPAKVVEAKNAVPKDAVLPTVETDIKLKEITEKTKAVEREEEEKGEGTEVREKVKVKRKDSLIKKSTEKTESNEKTKVAEKEKVAETRLEDKSYLSLENPADDNKTIKVPSYSHSKNRGIVYISHIPHGFFEAQMRDFFTQFGTITNLRLGRSRKTGKSKGYAFVEFKFHEVAKVVSETMNNYLMFNKILKCELLSKERCKPQIFLGKIKPNQPPHMVSRRNAKKIVNAPKTKEDDETRVKRAQKKIKTLQKALEDAGIDYKVNLS